MRLNLKVPFAEKDEAKKLGARWDAARKLWYIQQVADLAPFARWSPQAAAPGEAAAAPAVSASGARQQSTGKFVPGSAYVETTVACSCPPWETCPQCLSASF